jgi:hypothetical protein
MVKPMWESFLMTHFMGKEYLDIRMVIITRDSLKRDYVMVQQFFLKITKNTLSIIKREFFQRNKRNNDSADKKN